MNIVDYILTGANIICLFFSIKGACKVTSQYKKICSLSNYNNINYCYFEFCEIEKDLISLLALVGKTNRRGTNTNKILLDSANKIRNTLMNIRQHLTSAELNQISDFFNNQMDTYIDNIIANASQIELQDFFDSKYEQYKNSVQKSQTYLKQKKEKIENVAHFK